MTEFSDRIERLENRVDRIDDKISKNLEKIFEALEALKVESAKKECPAPGTCIGLSKELEHAIVAHNATMLRVERLELKIIEVERLTQNESRKVEQQFAKLEAQKAWILGAWSVIAFLAAVMGGVATIAFRYLMESK